MDRVKGKAAIVTGSASGIGKASALVLAEEGASVAITDIADDAGKETVGEITAKGGTAAYWHMNVSDEREVEKTFSEINNKFGKIDILVNNAGIPGPPKETHDSLRHHHHDDNQQQPLNDQADAAVSSE